MGHSGKSVSHCETRDDAREHLLEACHCACVFSSLLQITSSANVEPYVSRYGNVRFVRANLLQLTGLLFVHLGGGGGRGKENQKHPARSGWIVCKTETDNESGSAPIAHEKNRFHERFLPRAFVEFNSKLFC